MRPACGGRPGGAGEAVSAASGTLRVVRKAVAQLVLIGVVLGGCAQRERPPQWSSGGVSAWPFAPAKMLLHPLTHVERGPDGSAMIVCHVELLDYWGDTTKGVGKLTVQLFRPTGGGRAGATQDMVWNVDLEEPSFNASMYDPATRTYRLQLGGLPEWARGEGDSTRLLLRAKFIGPGPGGGSQELTSELALRS